MEHDDGGGLAGHLLLAPHGSKQPKAKKDQNQAQREQPAREGTFEDELRYMVRRRAKEDNARKVSANAIVTAATARCVLSLIIDELAVKLQTNEPVVYSGKRDPDSGEIMFLADILLTRPPKGYNAGTKLLMCLL